MSASQTPQGDEPKPGHALPLLYNLVYCSRAVAEVGAVMIVGGNIDGVTRVMTTAIALETSKGDLPLALALGLILLLVVLTLNAGAFVVKETARRRFGRRPRSGTCGERGDDSVAGVPESLLKKRKTLETIKAKRAERADKKAKTRVTKRKETRTISGFACTGYEIRQGEKVVTTIWGGRVLSPAKYSTPRATTRM